MFEKIEYLRFEKIVYLRNERGGKVHRIEFPTFLPTLKQIDDVVKSIDSCPFGYSVFDVSPDTCIITIKSCNNKKEEKAK